MFWGAFSYNGPIALVPVTGTMNSTKYVETLETNLLPHLENTPLADIPIFQHDNAPCHASRETKLFLQQHAVNVIEWPPYSPDLNPIENLWGIMKNKLKEQNVTTKAELLQIVQEIWASMSMKDVCKRLIVSMEKRIHECIRNRGGYIPY
jgi:transposase